MLTIVSEENVSVLIYPFFLGKAYIFAVVLFYSLINPNPGDLVATLTSKTQNCCVKFIIHPKNLKKIVFLLKRLVFSFVKARFYQNDVLIV